MSLKNLEKIGQLKFEPSNQREINGLIKSANSRLKDSNFESLSIDSRFDLAYNAAHGFALAALRWHNYRCDTRYLVFQCLEHTMNLETYKVQVLSNCHNKRNRAEYDGELEMEESLLQALIEITGELSQILENMRESKD
jgi:hypothetical protein